MVKEKEKKIKNKTHLDGLVGRGGDEQVLRRMEEHPQHLCVVDMLRRV
jgi:hypothetical protein